MFIRRVLFCNGIYRWVELIVRMKIFWSTLNQSWLDLTDDTNHHRQRRTEKNDDKKRQSIDPLKNRWKISRCDRFRLFSFELNFLLFFFLFWWIQHSSSWKLTPRNLLDGHFYCWSFSLLDLFYLWNIFRRNLDRYHQIQTQMKIQNHFLSNWSI